MGWIGRFIVVLLTWGLCSIPAAAHPHIFVDARAALIFDDDGALVEIVHEWTFDPAFSAWSVEGLDADGDGVVSRAEQQELADQDLEGLSEYQFYTFAGEGPENLDLVRGRGATRDLVDGRVVLSFGVAPSTPYHIRDTLELAINDPEYYVAITFDGPESVSLVNPPAGCSVRLQPGEDMPEDVAAALWALPPDVTELPPDLALALRGVQGAILVACPASGAAASPAIAGRETVEAMSAPAPEPAGAALPFGGPPPEPGFVLPRTGLLGWLSDQQQAFYAQLTAALGKLQQDRTAFWVLGSLSFLYGVFHAAGPGHGKVVISSYMLANERQLRRGVLLSFAAAMLQAVMAVALVGIAVAALGLTSMAVSQAAGWIGSFAYLLMVLLGLWLVLRQLFGWGHTHRPRAEPVDLADRARALLHGDDSESADPQRPDRRHHAHHHHDHDHDHGGHGHHHVIAAEDLRGGWREQLGVVLAVGLRPCSGALIVLVFALSQDVLAAGIAAVFLMGMGTAVTVAALAVLAVTAKDLAGRLAASGQGSGVVVLWWAELAGAVLLLAFGTLFLLSSL